MATSYRPSKGMQEAAKRALAWIKDGKAGQGFTDVGRKRASDIAAGRALSAETVLRMYSFFARHEVDKKATGFSAGEEGYPTPGRVAWDAWGGDAGFSWSTKIRNQLQKSARSLEMMASEEGDMAESMTVSDLKEELTELLADKVSFYFRAHGAHWNVVGTDFAEYHELFAKIYEDVYSSIDPLAEILRKLGQKAPFKLQDFIMLRTIDDSGMDSQDARVLATDLLAANDLLIEGIAEAFECADECNQQGIANFLAERLDAHQMWKWQLSASLGVEASEQDLTVEPAEDIEEEPSEEEPIQESAPTEAPIEEETAARSEENLVEARKAAIATAERVTMNAEIRAMDTTDGTMRIGGYAATFNNEATGLNFREVIAPGAFTNALTSANEDPIFLLINHDADGIPLASTKSGTLRLTQDEVGLRMEADLDPSNPKAQELASAVRRGDMTKMSFAFTVGADGQTKEDGLRTLTSFDKIYEVSAVTWPAYDATDLGMRSKQQADFDLRLRLAKARLTQSRLRK